MMSSAQAGTTTAALIFGGTAVAPSTPALTVTETFNGTAWTEVADLNTAIQQASGAGISTSALNFGGGQGPPFSTECESWNGTSWTEVANINTARLLAGARGLSNTSALMMGGYAAPGVNANVEKWNGTSWTEVANLTTARQSLGGAGTSTVALAISGYVTNNIQNTEEWNDPVYTIKTVTVS